MNFEGYPYTSYVIGGIVAFFLVRIGVGYWASRQVNNATDFIVAGRGLPIYMAASSIMATWFAGETLIGASKNSYEYGLQGVLADPFGAVLCLLISGMFFIRLMRRARYLTVVDFFEKRFGIEMSLMGSLVQLIAYVVWTAAQLVAGGIVIHSLLGGEQWVGMVIVGVIVTVYTIFGGMLADTLLDFIQMFFSAGGVSCVFFAVLIQVGGFEGLFNHGGSVNVPEAFAILPTAQGYKGYSGHVGWLYWISAWITIGLGSIATQDLMQRSMAARNEATSVWGSYVAAVLYFVFGTMSALIGVMMYKLFPELKDQQVDGLIIYTAQAYLPVWLNVIFMAALTSALMSTSDSSILAGASVVTENILPLVRGHMSDEEKLTWTRIMVAILGVFCIGIAVIIGELYQLAMMAWSVLLVGMFVPFAFGMYWKSANRLGAIAGCVGGFLSWLVFVAIYLPITKAANRSEAGEVLLDDAVWDAVYVSSPPAVLVSAILLVVVTLLTKKFDPPMELTDVDGTPLPLKNLLGIMSWRRIFRDEPEGSPPPVTVPVEAGAPMPATMPPTVP